MRSYARDSREAVCRLLALSMIVDGKLLPTELRALHGSAILGRVGADAQAFDDTVHALCADLLARAELHNGHIAVDARLLDRLLDDIADPLLRMHTLKGMLDIVHADRLLDSREYLVLQRAMKKWSAPRDGDVVHGR